MNFKTLVVALAMVAVTQAQLDPSLLNDPIYQPFIEVVLAKASICIADPGVTSGKFVASKCPGLVSIMKDIYNNVTEPAISCQPECVAVFNTLGDACDAALRKAFTTGTDKIAKAGDAFYAACDKLSSATSPTAAPTATSPSPSNTPSPATPSSSPVPSPSPTPAAPASAAITSVPQVLTLFVGAMVGMLFA